MKYHLPMIYAEVTQPILGFTGATFSTATLWLAQAPDLVSSPQLTGWMQLGGTAGLIGGLSYGCITLWKALQTQRTESAAERTENAATMAAERVAMNLAMTNERASHQADKAALNAEIRGELKEQTNKLIAVLEKLDPDK